MSRAAAPLCSSNVRVGIEARSAINVHASPARTTYDDPHVGIDNASEDSVAGIGVSILTVVATLALTLSVGFAIDTSGVELSRTDDGATVGNWLAEVDAISFRSLDVMSPDAGVTNAAWLRDIAEVSSAVRRVDHATGTARANATKISTMRLTKGSIRNDDQRERIDPTASF